MGSRFDGCGTFVAIADEAGGVCPNTNSQASSWTEQCFKRFTDPALSIEELDSPDRCSGARSASSYYHGTRSTAGSFGGALRTGTWNTLMEKALGTKKFTGANPVICDTLESNEEPFCILTYDEGMACSFISSGNVVDSMSLSVSTDGFADIDFGIVGSDRSVSNETVNTGGMTDCGQGDAMTHDTASFILTCAGSEELNSATCDFIDITMELSNSNSSEACLGNAETLYTAGALEITGTITAYLSDCDPFTSFTDGEECSLELIFYANLGEPDVQTITIYLPLIAITSCTTTWAENENRTYEIGYKALFDPDALGCGGDGYTIMINSEAGIPALVPPVFTDSELAGANVLDLELTHTATLLNTLNLSVLAASKVFDNLEDPTLDIYTNSGITYQWQSNIDGTLADIDGATGPTYSVLVTTDLAEEGTVSYRCVASNEKGDGNSTTCVVTFSGI